MNKKIFTISVAAIAVIVISVFLGVSFYKSSDTEYNRINRLIVDTDEKLCEINRVISVDDVHTISECFSYTDIKEELRPVAFKKRSDTVYSVFTVENYGKLYLIYDKNSDGKQLSSFTVIDKTADDFRQLAIGESTFRDVCDIDPCACYVTGNINSSYHLLSDGNTVTVHYDVSCDGNSILDCIVADIDVSDNSQYYDMFFDVDRP